MYNTKTIELLKNGVVLIELDEDRCPLVAVVGGGFCGTLTAVHLLRAAAPGTRVVLIERTGDFGPGIAYRTTDARHRLNVPAGRMSAFPDRPDDFVAWAEVDPAAFVSRRRYGAYLRTRLAQAEAASAGRLDRVTGEVVRLRRAAGRIALGFRDSRELGCDRVVLALGWPHGSPACELPADPRVYEDPWVPGALEADGTTVVVGTGPTAVDVALSLCGRSRSAHVVVVSRSGRLPFAHRPGLRPPAPPPSLPAGEVRLARLEARVRAHVARMVGDGYDWRDAVDGLRPVVPQLWRRLPLDDRREFVRARARSWEVRRRRGGDAPAPRRDRAALRRRHPGARGPGHRMHGRRRARRPMRRPARPAARRRWDRRARRPQLGPAGTGRRCTAERLRRRPR
jgi:uncharacterized NAD(P)/FAD-binding protein YdhS